MATVNIDRSDPTIPVVILDRPDRLNALGTELVSDLKDAMASLTRDREARVVIITGAGRGFCAGADLQGGGPRPPTPMVADRWGRSTGPRSTSPKSWWPSTSARSP